MKKLFLFLLVAGLASQTVFADLWWNGWGQATFAPVLYVHDGPNPDNDGLYSGLGVGWGLGRQLLTFDVAGNWWQAGNVGFRFQIFVDGGGSGTEPWIHAGDYMEVYAMPFEWIRVDLGRYMDGAFRGRIGEGPFDDFGVQSKGGDEIFSAFWGQDAFLLTLNLPVDGLVIKGQLNNLGGLGFWSPNNSDIWSGDRKGTKFSDLLKYKSHAAIGYTISGIGMARVGYVADKSGWSLNTSSYTASGMMNISSPRIEGAFLFDRIYNLTLDLGFKVPFSIEKEINYTKYDKIQAPLQVSVGANYKFFEDRINITGRVDTKFLGELKVKGASSSYKVGPEVNAHLVPSYDFDTFITGLDFGFAYMGDCETATGITYEGGSRFGAGAWIQKNLNLGFIAVGLFYRLPTEIYGKKETGIFSIPITVRFGYI